MPLSPVLTDEMKSLLGTPKKKKNPSKMQVLSSPDGDFLFILKGGNTVMKIGDQKTWFCEETLERDLNRMGFRLNSDWTVSKR
jgi:hypothetical protein